MTKQPDKPNTWALVYVYLGWAVGIITTGIADILITWALEPGGVPLWAAYVACGLMGVLAYLCLYRPIKRRQDAAQKAQARTEPRYGSITTTEIEIRSAFTIAVLEKANDRVPFGVRNLIADEMLKIMKADRRTSNDNE